MRLIFRERFSRIYSLSTVTVPFLLGHAGKNLTQVPVCLELFEDICDIKRNMDLNGSTVHSFF